MGREGGRGGGRTGEAAGEGLEGGGFGEGGGGGGGGGGREGGRGNGGRWWWWRRRRTTGRLSPFTILDAAAAVAGARCGCVHGQCHHGRRRGGGKGRLGRCFCVIRWWCHNFGLGRQRQCLLSVRVGFLVLHCLMNGVGEEERYLVGRGRSPATQPDQADAESLDCNDDGSWAPVLLCK